MMMIRYGVIDEFLLKTGKSGNLVQESFKTTSVSV